MRNEPIHVYQNRKEIYDVSGMYYCPVCNGYYGVPHPLCGRRGGCALVHSCACRRHTEEDGRPREGSHGWIIGEKLKHCGCWDAGLVCCRCNRNDEGPC